MINVGICRECEIDAETFDELLEHADEAGHVVVGR